MTYKKRAKSGWSAGKAEKKSSNRSERMFEKEEIVQELNIIEDPDYVYKVKTKKKFKNSKEKRRHKLEKSLRRAEKHLRLFEQYAKNRTEVSVWLQSVIDRCKSDIAKTKEKLKELLNDKPE